MKLALSLIGLFNFCDWVIALFIAGTAARIEGKDGRRTFLAVGLMLFFTAFALVRLGEFVNVLGSAEWLSSLFRSAPRRFSIPATLLSACKTSALLFTWFAVSIERRDRQGLLSGNVIRHAMIRIFEKLR